MKKKMILLIPVFLAIVAVAAAVIRFNKPGIHVIFDKFYHIEIERPCIVVFDADKEDYYETTLKIDIKYYRPWNAFKDGYKLKGGFRIEGLFDDFDDKGISVVEKKAGQLTFVHYFDDLEKNYCCNLCIKDKELDEIITVIDGDIEYTVYTAPTVNEVRERILKERI